MPWSPRRGTYAEQLNYATISLTSVGLWRQATILHGSWRQRGSEMDGLGILSLHSTHLSSPELQRRGEIFPITPRVHILHLPRFLPRSRFQSISVIRKVHVCLLSPPMCSMRHDLVNCILVQLCSFQDQSLT